MVGLGVIAVLGLTIWFVESRTGWDSLEGSTRARAVERFSAEASRVADKPVTIYCDESRDFVGAVQHADGVAEVGGERAYLTPEICFDLYRLAFEDDVREAGRAARSPSSHTRRGTCAVSETRGRRSATGSSRASRSAARSGSPKGEQASSCGSSSPRTRCAARERSNTSSRPSAATAAARPRSDCRAFRSGAACLP